MSAMNLDSRRDFLGRLGKAGLGMTGLSLCAASLSGCVANQRTTYDLGLQCGEEAKKLPGEVTQKIGLALGENAAAPARVTQADFVQSLTRARTSLLFTRDMLSQEITFKSGNYGVAAKRRFYAEDFSQACVTGDYSVRLETLAQTDGYKSLVEAAKNMRQTVISQIKQASRDIVGFNQEDSNSSRCNALQGALMASLSGRLGVLVERIEDKTLLASGNVIDQWHKTGSTSMLLGRTEHLNEAIAELGQLIDTFKPVASR